MTALQTTWFLLIGILLVGYAILDGFDLGVGMLHLFVAKNDHQRRLLLNSIGPVWDGNEVWLLTAGGAIFAAFPAVYATVFSGFYLALMLLLVALILRAVSLEFRSKEESHRWRATWDTAFAVGSFIPALLFGVAIGNIIRGVPLSSDGEFAGSFLGLLNPFALATGLLSVAMFVMQGAAWLNIRTEGELRERAIRIARASWVVMMLLWLVVTIWSMPAAPHMWQAYNRPMAWVTPILFAVAMGGFYLTLRSRLALPAFGFSSLSIALLIATMGQGLYPYMVPAINEPRASLTIFNASSSQNTLTAMLIIALIGVPVVLAYTIFIYRKFLSPVSLDEHSY